MKGCFILKSMLVGCLFVNADKRENEGLVNKLVRAADRVLPCLLCLLRT